MSATVRVAATVLLLPLAALTGGAQETAQESSRERASRLVRRGDVAPPPTTTVTRAIRATSAITVDGAGTDAVWAEAPAVDGFRVFDPVEDGEPTLRTEARFAYDERNFYVLVRAFDPRPDSIMALLSRRDDRRLGELRALAEHARIPVATVDETELAALAGGERHQGAVALLSADAPGRAGDPETLLEEALAAACGPPLLLVLDGVQDPHNLGACLRTADAAGVSAVIQSARPTVCR